MHLVLDVQVRAPVADLSRAPELANLEHWLVVAILHSNAALVLVRERDRRRLGDIRVRAVGERRAGLGHGCFGGESGHVNLFSVGLDARCRGAERVQKGGMLVVS